MKIFKTECSHFRENLFSVVLPASGLISLQQSLIGSSKLNFMMKQHFDFLPTKSEQLQLITTEISPFLYNWVQSFSVGRTTIHTRDLNLSPKTVPNVSVYGPDYHFQGQWLDVD